jgi:phosphoribosylglycinamide formyltransferase-1
MVREDVGRQGAEHPPVAAAAVPRHPHFIVAELDSGPAILQAAVPVLPGDTAETLAARILVEEHRIYPEALKLVAQGKVKLEGGRAVFA